MKNLMKKLIALCAALGAAWEIQSQPSAHTHLNTLSASGELYRLVFALAVGLVLALIAQRRLRDCR